VGTFFWGKKKKPEIKIWELFPSGRWSPVEQGRKTAGGPKKKRKEVGVRNLKPARERFLIGGQKKNFKWPRGAFRRKKKAHKRREGGGGLFFLEKKRDRLGETLQSVKPTLWERKHEKRTRGGGGKPRRATQAKKGNPLQKGGGGWLQSSGGDEGRTAKNLRKKKVINGPGKGRKGNRVPLNGWGSKGKDARFWGGENKLGRGKGGAPAKWEGEPAKGRNHGSRRPREREASASNHAPGERRG